MALAAPTTAVAYSATLWIVRSASSSWHAQSCAPAGVDSAVSATSCSGAMLLVGANAQHAERLDQSGVERLALFWRHRPGEARGTTARASR